MPENPTERNEMVTTVSTARSTTLAHADLEERRRGLVRFVRARVRDVEQAEDLVQDVMYQFVRSADAGTAIEDATAWLFRAARNRIVDWYRKRKSETIEAEADQAADLSFDPQRIAESGELWEAFLLALDELPEDQREVFILQELEGVSFREIAEMTGVNQNTLLSRKRYAVLALRTKLKLYR